MKPTKISESGLIGNDGRLRMPMDRVNAFFEAHKGERVVVRFEAAAPGSTALQLAYYYNYIVPTVTAALYEQGTRMRERAVDKWLVEQYPGEKDERILGFGTDVTEARQMDKRQMFDFFDWLKQYAAENLYVYIEDPRIL
jgi:hypothetical protein